MASREARQMAVLFCQCDAAYSVVYPQGMAMPSVICCCGFSPSIVERGPLVPRGFPERGGDGG